MKILLVRVSSLGDVLHNLPMVADILRHHPDATIDWVVEEGYVSLVRLNPRAPIRKVHFGNAPVGELLDIRGFNLNDKLEIDQDFLKAEEDHHCDEHCDHHHDHHHGHDHHHDHGHHQDHNLNAAYVHVLTDALTSVLAIAALAAGAEFATRSGFRSPTSPEAAAGG